MEEIKNLLEFHQFPELIDIPDNYVQAILDSESAYSERMEFLGDAVLDLIVTNYLIDSFEYLTPGEATSVRSYVVSNMTIAYLLIKKKLCLNRDKICGDKMEVLIGVLYTYTQQNIAFVEKYLNKVFKLDDIIYDLIQVELYRQNSEINIDKIVDKHAPVYSQWEKNKNCKDGVRRETRKCISGTCDVLERYTKCEDWSGCDDNRYKTRVVNGVKEIKPCNKHGVCNKNGQRKVTGPLGEFMEQCPESYYYDGLYKDLRCRDGITTVYKKCKNPNKCENMIWDSYPCEEELVTLEKFGKLDQDIQWDTYNKLREYAIKHGIQPDPPIWNVKRGYELLLSQLSEVKI